MAIHAGAAILFAVTGVIVASEFPIIATIFLIAALWQLFMWVKYD